ncbi:MAG: mCpol domain-containing protein [Syntrophobacteraceae bacterium]
MTHIYIDGDDIGLKIEKCFIDNDEASLHNINREVGEIVCTITNYLCSNGFCIIFSGADGIIAKSNYVDCEVLLKLIRTLNSNYTFSIGLGDSLRNAYFAVRYAKSISKDVAVAYDGRDFMIKR